MTMISYRNIFFNAFLNMFHKAVQANKTSPVKHKNKTNVLSCLIKTFDGPQILSNMTKYHHT